MPSMSGAAYHTKAGLSAIFDSSLGYGMLLDDTTGTYWKLDRAALSLLHAFSSAHEGASSTLEADGCLTRGSTLESLLDAGLMKQGHGQVLRTDTRVEDETFDPKISQTCLGLSHDMPSVLRLLEYYWLNVRFRLEVAFSGWRPVRLRKSIPSLIQRRDETLLLTTVEEILSCMRIATALPLTSRDCIPRALAAFEICRRRGLTPRLVVGSYVVPFEPHIWVECGDQTIDNGCADFSLERFVPLQDRKFWRLHDTADPGRSDSPSDMPG